MIALLTGLLAATLVLPPATPVPSNAPARTSEVVRATGVLGERPDASAGAGGEVGSESRSGLGLGLGGEGGGKGRGTNGVAGEGAAAFALPVAEAAGSAEDRVEADYRRLLDMDDAAHEEIDGWIREADAAGSAADEEALRKRIESRVGGIEAAYREFLGKHTAHVNARVAYGSFLNDLGRETEARTEWEKALERDPKNAAIYNNLAGIYGHRGPITNAFVYYEKAIELAPKEALYHQNFATTLSLFRRDVMEHYGIADEQKVFDLALSHYRQAQEIEPRSFLIATDLAQTYYLIKPPRHDDALAAWRRAYELASDELEREGVRVHLARVQVQAGRWAEARTNLSLVTNVNYAPMKERILKTLEKKERGGAEDGGGEPKGTDGPSAEASKPRTPAPTNPGE